MSDFEDMYDDFRDLNEEMFKNSAQLSSVPPKMSEVNITGMSQNERRILFVKNRIKEIETEEKNKYNNKLLLKFKNELIELEKK
tara:strand:- start:447 stop:698 length:252 start_codon:yes stop_codon:yes gene_type:complete